MPPAPSDIVPRFTVRFPPPGKGAIRVSSSEGFWRLEDAGAGHTRVHYESFSEAGGRIPAWVIARASRSRIVADFRTLEGLAQRPTPDGDPSALPAVTAGP